MINICFVRSYLRNLEMKTPDPKNVIKWYLYFKLMHRLAKTIVEKQNKPIGYADLEKLLY